MSSNSLPRRVDELFALAEHLADGLNFHETAIGIKQNTEDNVRADLAAARDATNGYRAVLSMNKDHATAQAQADSNGKTFIAAAKSVLTCHLGNRWASAWASAAFTNNSQVIPATMAETTW